MLRHYQIPFIGCIFLLSSMAAAIPAHAWQTQLEWRDAPLEIDYIQNASTLLKDPNTPEDYKRQATLWVHAVAGDEVSALELECHGTELCSPPSDHLTVFASNRLEDTLPAIPGILSAVAEHNVVILNEAHNSSRHRAFALTLLEELAKSGFTHFAAEALYPLVADDIAKDPHNLWSPHIYIQDPLMAALFKRAHELGLKMISYEQNAKQRKDCPIDTVVARIRCRENAQADNLFEAIKAAEGPVKLFVYVGFNHVTECENNRYGEPTRWLAYELSQRLKRDILTIDQTYTKYYKVEGGETVGPIILPDDLNKAGKPECTDIEVYHPQPSYKHERPTWLYQVPGREAVDIDLTKLDVERPFLLRAQHKGALDKSIAVDQMILKGEKTSLILPPGAFDVAVIKDGKMATIGEVKEGQFVPGF